MRSETQPLERGMAALEAQRSRLEDAAVESSAPGQRLDAEEFSVPRGDASSRGSAIAPVHANRLDDRPPIRELMAACVGGPA